MAFKILASCKPVVTPFNTQESISYDMFVKKLVLNVKGVITKHDAALKGFSLELDLSNKSSRDISDFIILLKEYLTISKFLTIGIDFDNFKIITPPTNKPNHDGFVFSKNILYIEKECVLIFLGYIIHILSSILKVFTNVNNDFYNHFIQDRSWGGSSGYNTYTPNTTPSGEDFLINHTGYLEIIKINFQDIIDNDFTYYDEQHNDTDTIELILSGISGEYLINYGEYYKMGSYNYSTDADIGFNIKGCGDTISYTPYITENAIKSIITYDPYINLRGKTCNLYLDSSCDNLMEFYTTLKSIAANYSLSKYTFDFDRLSVCKKNLKINPLKIFFSRNHKSKPRTTVKLCGETYEVDKWELDYLVDKMRKLIAKLIEFKIFLNGCNSDGSDIKSIYKRWFELNR